MKLRKAQKRLNARIAGYNEIRGTDISEKRKRVNKSQFTKPGSYSK